MDPNDVTIIVPTRNEVANIPAFLASIPPAVRLIVVDASDDETPDLIERLRPHNTQVLRRPTKIAEARQIGAEAAQTEWFLFTDADVIFAPDYFDHLTPYAHLDVVAGPKLSRDQYIEYYKWFSRGMQLLTNLGIASASGSNVLVRRRAFFDSGGFDLGLTVNEDSELAWRIQRHGFRVGFAPDLKVYARDHRRLNRGRTKKTLHTFVRCFLLYTGLMPKSLRRKDWGYWKPASDTKTAAPKSVHDRQQA